MRLFGWFREPEVIPNVEEKLNPAQENISMDASQFVGGSQNNTTTATAHADIEAVNRGVSMIVNACTSLDYDIKETIGTPKLTQKRTNKLINFTPNPYQSMVDFRMAIFTDYVLTGNAYIYFDDAFMYHIPSDKMEVVTDTKTFIKGYIYNSNTKFNEDEIFSFKDVTSAITGTEGLYRGKSRLTSGMNSVKNMNSMTEFQRNFFDNGAVFGLVLVTDNTLSTVAKEKTINHWLQRYNARKGGGRRPVIFDKGLKPHTIANSSFKDLDFDTSVKTHSDKILTSLGVPPILLAGGNNANISPNLRLFYLETVLPIVRAYNSALERFFGFNIEPITSSVSALQPELKEIASFNATLVNAGVITPDEARINLRYRPLGGENGKIRIPANIAGSAVQPDQGGKPKEDKKD